MLSKPKWVVDLFRTHLEYVEALQRLYVARGEYEKAKLEHDRFEALHKHTEHPERPNGKGTRIGGATR